MNDEEAARVEFDKGGGLVPVIVQDSATQQVLMLAYMNRETLAETRESGEATFYSRSRGGRWRKGETSGNRMKVASLQLDCDNDTILMRVDPAGPACHTGTVTCFGDKPALGVGQLAALERTIGARANASPDESWTAKLLSRGHKRIAQKVGEEGVETALAGAAGETEELCEEMADLFYHCLVLLRSRGVSVEAVMDVLARRAEQKK
jgi:phosphoribosyl-ATP pyrophosphohydrolase/phosphoribosyl-AMP cyclohydrolase